MNKDGIISVNLDVKPLTYAFKPPFLRFVPDYYFQLFHF